MNILVTGSSGYIGSRLCDLLQQAGHSVTKFDIKESIDQDIQNIYYLELLLIKNKIDVVYHLAAIRNIHACELNILACITTNLKASMHLYELCVKHSVKFIFASTLATSQFSLNNYALCKFIAEKNMHDAVIVRLSNVVGSYPAHQRHEFPTLTDNIIDAILSAKTLKVMGNCHRNFVFIDDVAMYFINALHMSVGIYDCVGKTNATIQTWIDKFEQHFNCVIKKEFTQKNSYDAENLAVKNVQFDFNYFLKIVDSYGVAK